MRSLSMYKSVVYLDFVCIFFYFSMHCPNILYYINVNLSKMWCCCNIGGRTLDPVKLMHFPLKLHCLFIS